MAIYLSNSSIFRQPRGGCSIGKQTMRNTEMYRLRKSAFRGLKPTLGNDPYGFGRLNLVDNVPSGSNVYY